MIAKLIFFLFSFVLAGSQFSTSSATLLTTFNEKIGTGDINAVQSLIKSNQNYIENDSVKQYRNDGFLLAVKKRHAPVVELLLQNGNIDAAAKNNKAIRLASANGDVDMVKLLLARPEVNPGVLDNEALLVATKNGHTEVVRLLLDHPNVESSARNYLAIFMASELNHPDIVKLFINNGRFIPTNVGSHTLERAAHFGNVELVRYLLGYPYYSYLAHLVVIGDDYVAIKTLVDAGYKIDQETLKRSLNSARNNGNEEIANYLSSLIEKPKLPERRQISLTEQCAICLADGKLLDGFMTTCQHQFHTECLQKWISRHHSCPICRSSTI